MEDVLMNSDHLTVENWTPHAIVVSHNLVNYYGEWETYETTYEPSGSTARLEKESKMVGDIGMFPVSKEVIVGHNLPEPREGVLLLVSAMILSAFPERSDLIAPDTNHATRNEKGHIVSVPGFVCN